MKPPPFRYARPETLDKVLHLLEEYDGEARVLAGGQSLIPILNFRLARPEVLVDIALVKELRHIRVKDGMLRIGAAVTQNTVERSDQVARVCPLLGKAVPFVGHLQNRVRGTVVGSIAHADPAAELPAVAIALEATMVVRSATDREDNPGEPVLLSDRSRQLWNLARSWWRCGSRLRRKTRTAVAEVAPRSGDFAVAGVAGKLRTTRGGKVREVALALFGVGGVPQRLHEVEARLLGQRLTADRLDDDGPPDYPDQPIPTRRMSMPTRPTGLGYPANSCVAPSLRWRR